MGDDQHIHKIATYMTETYWPVRDPRNTSGAKTSRTNHCACGAICARGEWYVREGSSSDG